MSESSGVDTQLTECVEFTVLLELSLSDRDAVGGMIAKSGIVGDQQMRQSFCLAIGIDSGSLRITELPPNQFGQALVQYIIDNQKANSWDALGDELRKHVEGKYLDTLNAILQKAKEPKPVKPSPPPKGEVTPAVGELLPLAEIADVVLHKIERRLRQMNWTLNPSLKTQPAVNLLAAWYFSAQFAEIKELSERVNRLTEKLNHDPKDEQLTSQFRQTFRKLLRLCEGTQKLLQEELKGESLEARHVFGQNTLNCLEDVIRYNNKALITLNQSSGDPDTTDFQDALIGINDTVPRLIEKFGKINQYIQNILES